MTIVIRLFLIIAFPPSSWGSQVSFDQALAAYVEKSPILAVQRAEVKSKEAALTPLRWYYLPTLSASASQGQLGADSVSASGSQVSATLKANVFRFGGSLAAETAAENDLEKARQQLRLTQFAEEGRATQALLNEVSAQMQLQSLRRTLESQQKSYRIAQERFQRGLLPRQELEKVSVDLGNIQARVSDAMIKENQARGDLAGRLGPVEVEITWPWRSRFASTKKKLNRTAEEHPSVQSSRAVARAEQARYSVLRKSLLPSLDATVTPSYATGFFNQTPPGNSSWVGQLTLTIPLFDHFEVSANSEAQWVVYEASVEQQNEALRKVRAEQDSARNNFDLALESAQARAKNLTVATRLLDDNLKRFQMGRITANEVTFDQNRVSDSEILEIRGWESVHQAYATLCHSSGLNLSECQ